MQIKDLVSFYVNESSHTLDVTFRIDSDLDDEVRTDQIGFDEIKSFGYNFLDDKIDVYKTLFEDESFDEHRPPPPPNGDRPFPPQIIHLMRENVMGTGHRHHPLPQTENQLISSKNNGMNY